MENVQNVLDTHFLEYPSIILPWQSRTGERKLEDMKWAWLAWRNGAMDDEFGGPTGKM